MNWRASTAFQAAGSSANLLPTGDRFRYFVPVVFYAVFCVLYASVCYMLCMLPHFVLYRLLTAILSHFFCMSSKGRHMCKIDRLEKLCTVAQSYLITADG